VDLEVAVGVEVGVGVEIVIGVAVGVVGELSIILLVSESGLPGTTGVVVLVPVVSEPVFGAS
jgi:hypothetical protein